MFPTISVPRLFLIRMLSPMSSSLTRSSPFRRERGVASCSSLDALSPHLTTSSSQSSAAVPDLQPVVEPLALKALAKEELKSLTTAQRAIKEFSWSLNIVRHHPAFPLIPCANHATLNSPIWKFFGVAPPKDPDGNEILSANTFDGSPPALFCAVSVLHAGILYSQL